MPIQKGKNTHGVFFQSRTRGKKYFYDPQNISSIGDAWRKAVKQTSAMHVNGYKRT